MPNISRFFVPLVVFLVCSGCSGSGCRHHASSPTAAIPERIGQADSLRARGQFTDALAILDDLCTGSRDSLSDSLAGECYRLAGICRERLGLYDSTIAAYHEAIARFRSSGITRCEQQTSLLLADLLSALGNDRTALSIARNAVRASRLAKDSVTTCSALSAAAASLHRLQQFGEEVQTLSEYSSADSALHPGRAANPAILNRTAAALLASGLASDARTVFERSFAAAAAQNDTPSAIHAWSVMARSFNRAGRPDSALRAWSRALTWLSNECPASLRVETLTGLGYCAFRLRHQDDAVRFLSDAAVAARSAGDRASAEIIRLMLVATGEFTGETGRDSSWIGSVSECESVLSLCRNQRYPAGEALALFLEATILRQHGDTARAVPLFHDALQVARTFVNRLPETDPAYDAIDAVMRTLRSDWYEPVLAAEAAGRNAGDLFMTAEQKNLDDLSVFFLHSTIRTANAEADQALSALQQTESRLSFLSRNLVGDLSRTNSGEERTASLTRLLQQESGNLGMAERSCSRLAPNFTRLLVPGSLSLADIRDSIPAGSAVIEYVPAADSLYIIVCRRDTAAVRSAAIDRLHLTGLIREYERIVSSTDPVPARARECMSVLTTVLWTPVVQDLSGATTLFLVPPREFGYLPVHVLASREIVPADQFDIRYLPTAAALLFTAVPPAPLRQMLAFGFAGHSGWNVEDELRDIHGFIEPARIALSTLATIQYLDTARCDLLHIDAEFRLDTDVPDHSVLTVSDGLTADGMQDVPIGRLLSVPPAQVLVVGNLSPVAGGCARYIPAALLARGYPAVIAALWQGDRKVRRDFNQGYYTRLQGGAREIQAYLQTIHDLSRTEYEGPGSWGMYVRFGK